MSVTTARLETSIEDHMPGPDISIRWLDDRRHSTIRLEHAVPLGPQGTHTHAAEDLLAIAIAAYCTDRSIIREDQPDAWTRHIELDVPVHDPGRWGQDALGRILSHLTGDYWHIKLRQGQPCPQMHTSDMRSLSSAPATLFSGGVDSLAGALELAKSSGSTLLISYFGDGPTGKLQQRLVPEVGGVAQHYSFRVIGQPADSWSGWPGFIDSTMRSRSLLFIALGLLVARTHDADRLQMPENGYIALNVPLHAGRIGSLSTRTAHPQFVGDLNQTIAAAGMGAHVVNPFVEMTKGEVAGRLAALAPHLAATTISCAHPTASRWDGQTFRNCGYCYPCLIRRAGFHRVGTDQTDYWIDPFTDVSFYWDGKKPQDIRSMARFLLDPPTIGDVMATGRLGSFDAAQRLYRMHERGVAELNDLFQSRASRAILDRLGL